MQPMAVWKTATKGEIIIQYQKQFSEKAFTVLFDLTDFTFSIQNHHNIFCQSLIYLLE